MKRFYTDVRVVPHEAGYAILLDAQYLKTPGGAVLCAPTYALADAVSAEWSTQGKTIDPNAMPLTRHANTAIDRISAHRAAIVDTIARYAHTDVVCYRAHYPADLVILQSQTWDPLLEWLERTHHIRLIATTSLRTIEQDVDPFPHFRAIIATYDDWTLAALHEVTNISGSLIIALALAADHLTPDQAWRAGQLDELYQASRWGIDPLAEAARQTKHTALLEAARLFQLLRTPA